MPEPQQMQVQVGQNGRLLDYGRTVGQSSNTAGEIAGFLDGLVKVGAPLYKQYLEGQGQSQATELFRNGLDPGAFARTATQEQRDVLRTVNPFAQEIILDAAAKASTTTFVETLAIERSKSNVLKDYTAPPEVRAKEEARIRAIALEVSGAGNIQGPAMAPYLGTIAQSEAKLKTDTYQEQAALQRADQDRVFEKGIVPALQGLATSRDNTWVEEQGSTPITAARGTAGRFEKPASVVYERASGQPGVDYWFPSKEFPAVMSGKVKDVGKEPGYGNYVVIESVDERNGQKVDVLYGHLPDDGIYVKPGQTIQEGEFVGKQGGTGNVKSADGTIASVDFLAPAPAGSKSMAPYSDFDGLRRHVTAKLQRGGNGAPAATPAGALAASTPSPIDDTAWTKYASEFGKNIEGQLKEVLASGMYTPNGYAERFANSINETLGELIANDNLSGAMGLLRGLKGVMTANEIKTPGGVSLWDIRVGGEGQTIRTMINARMAGLKDAYEAWDRKKRLAGLGPDLVAAAQGDPEARARVDGALVRFKDDPEGLSQAMSLFGQAQAYGQQPTPAQLQEQAAIEIELNEPNRSRQELNNRILSANLTPQQRIGLLKGNTEPANPQAQTLQLAANGRAGSEDWQVDAVTNILNAKVNSGLISGDAKAQEQEAQRIMREMTIEATGNVEKKVKGLQSIGESVSPMQAAEMYREEIDRIQKREIQTITKGAGEKPRTFTQTVMTEVNQVQEKMKSTQGVLTINLFPQTVLTRARRAGVPMEAKAVRNFFLQDMRSLQGPDGKPLFPDVNKTYRDMQERAKGNRPELQAPAGIPRGGRIGSDMGYPETNLQRLNQRVNGSQAPAKPQGNQSSGARQPASQNVALETTRRIVTGALDMLMGVQPAVAAGSGGRGLQAPQTLQRTAARNIENLDAMNAVWSGRQRMGPNTPPLPQVAASAPTVRLPLAINVQNHPIFVAIGIAEGTRTPSGGFTKAYYGHRDPGDGNWNRGTVSGGRGTSAAPAQVDRQWMATLTRQAMGVAPALMRLGLREGTAGWNRLMFNVLDLAVQAPTAVPDFIRKLPQVLRQGATIEAVAKARADSFIDPGTGRLDAGGFGNSYSRLLADQRSRAGAFDYKRRL